MTQICPLDLPVLLADTGGKGVAITAVCHSTSQLADRWGEHGAKTIWACCGTKVILGGISDAATLEDISQLCGTVVIGEDDSKTVRVMPPEAIQHEPGLSRPGCLHHDYRDECSHRLRGLAELEACGRR